jgi:hypothetical protein
MTYSYEHVTRTNECERKLTLESGVLLCDWNSRVTDLMEE